MRMLILAAALLAAVTTGASAQTTDWTGGYAGLFGAYADGEHSGDTVYTDNTGAYDLGGGTINLDGGLGGLAVGYQHQFGSLVAGIEGDFAFGDVSGSEKFDLPGGYQWNVNTEIKSVATLRGRLGFSFGPALVYGTGGLAWADTSFGEDAIVTTDEQGMPAGTRVVNASGDDQQFGWAYGAGAELSLRHGWSIKGEWLHIDLGDADYKFTGTAYPDSKEPVPNYSNDSFPGSLEFDVYKVGLNYRF